MDAAVPAFMSVTGADSETALRYLTVRNGGVSHLGVTGACGQRRR